MFSLKQLLVPEHKIAQFAQICFGAEHMYEF